MWCLVQITCHNNGLSYRLPRGLKLHFWPDKRSYYSLALTLIGEDESMIGLFGKRGIQSMSQFKCWSAVGDSTIDWHLDQYVGVQWFLNLSLLNRARTGRLTKFLLEKQRSESEPECRSDSLFKWHWSTFEPKCWPDSSFEEHEPAFKPGCWSDLSFEWSLAGIWIIFLVS
jgi:hypothetical protein